MDQRGLRKLQSILPFLSRGETHFRVLAQTLTYENGFIVKPFQLKFTFINQELKKNVFPVCLSAKMFEER